MTAAALRSDGAATRRRLLLVATRLFAQQGYSATSTRAIALAAAANVGAIRYYFGDKDGLYRAALECMPAPASDCGVMSTQDGLSLRQALRYFYTDQVKPAQQDELSRNGLRLRTREALAPSGRLQDGLDMAFRSRHLALVRLLCIYLGVTMADDNVHRLAMAVAGLASPLLLSHQAIAAIRPSLVDTPLALEQWTEHLAGYAELMLLAEAARRRLAPQPSPLPC